MSDEDDNGRPIVPLEYLRSSIIDFGAERIARGQARFSTKSCTHPRLVFSNEERRIWCEQCETTVSGFDAFMSVVARWQAWTNKLRDQQTVLDAALKLKLHLRAARKIEASWMGRRAPCCSQCKKAILPEDFVEGEFVEVSLDLARQARKEKK